jgi:hypothetical protein
MATKFTAKAWSALNDLVRHFERAPRRAKSPERMRLRRAMRSQGYYAQRFGLQNTTRADLRRLLDEGLLRIIG